MRRSTWCSTARMPSCSTSCVSAARRLREHAVEPAAEHPAQQIERRGTTPAGHRRARTPGTACRPRRDRTRPARRRRRRRGSAAAGAAVEHRVEAFEREQLPEERGRDERASAGRERAQRAGEHPVQRRVRLALLGDLVDGFEHRDRVGEQRVLLAQHAVRLERLGLGHDVELAALVALERDPARSARAGRRTCSSSCGRPWRRRGSCRCPCVRIVTIRSASPSLIVRSTTPSSRYSPARPPAYHTSVNSAACAWPRCVRWRRSGGRGAGTRRSRRRGARGGSRATARR